MQAFLSEHQVRSVVDLGCGDWQFSRTLSWDGIQYLGVDLVESVIRANRKRFQKSNVSFALAGELANGLPAADLLLAKDIFQHWSNQSIRDFLPQLAKFRYALITNGVKVDGPTVNRDIPNGGFRDLDLNLPPFSLKLERAFEFSNPRRLFPYPMEKPWKKVVYLYRRPD